MQDGLVPQPQVLIRQKWQVLDDMFALAANGFNKPSETFIRSHACHLAPDKTLLIAEKRSRKTLFDAPLLSYSKRWPTFIPNGATTLSIILSILSPSRVFKSRSEYIASVLQDLHVHTLMAEYGPTGVNLLEAAQIANCALFVHFHGVDASKMLNDTDVVKSYQRLFDQASGIIAPSQFLANNLVSAGCPLEKLHVVPCGVDVTDFTPGQPEAFRLLSVGRFTEKKSPLSTIGAFALVKKTCPEATLEMIGDGPLLSDSKAEAKRLSLEDDIVFTGTASPVQVQEAMRRSRIFLQHSVTAKDGDIEGLPVAILEAMATGLPVVSTLHSGIPEAVVDGQTGLLVPEFDVDGMASKIAALLNDPELAAQYGSAGRRRVIDNYSHEVTNRQLREIMNLFEEDHR